MSPCCGPKVLPTFWYRRRIRSGSMMETDCAAVRYGFLTRLRFAGWRSGWPLQQAVASMTPSRGWMDNSTGVGGGSSPFGCTRCCPLLRWRGPACRCGFCGPPPRIWRRWRRLERSARRPCNCWPTSFPRGWRFWSPAAPARVRRPCWPRLWVLSPITNGSSASRMQRNWHRQHPHLIRLVARSANVEGAGEITLRQLVRQALRMRPDRIVVGEVRGAEVVDLLAALNTGHDGGAGTVHANSPAEVPARLEALAALGGLDRAALHSQLAAAVQVVLHVSRGRRRAALSVRSRCCSAMPTAGSAHCRSGTSIAGSAAGRRTVGAADRRAVRTMSPFARRRRPAGGRRCWRRRRRAGGCLEHRHARPDRTRARRGRWSSWPQRSRVVTPPAAVTDGRGRRPRDRAAASPPDRVTGGAATRARRWRRPWRCWSVSCGSVRIRCAPSGLPRMSLPDVWVHRCGPWRPARNSAPMSPRAFGRRLADSSVPAYWNRLAVYWQLAAEHGLAMSTLMRAAHRDIVDRQRFADRVQAGLGRGAGHGRHPGRTARARGGAR